MLEQILINEVYDEFLDACHHLEDPNFKHDAEHPPTHLEMLYDMVRKLVDSITLYACCGCNSWRKNKND